MAGSGIKINQDTIVVRSKQALTGTCVGHPRGLRLYQTTKNRDAG